MDFFISNAYAQSAGAGSDLMGLLPLVLIFVVFYFLLIRPQQKRQKEHRDMVEALQVGDEVSAAGLLGKVTKAGEQFITVEISDGVDVIMQRHTITAVMPKGTVKSAKSGKAAKSKSGKKSKDGSADAAISEQPKSDD